MENKFHIDEVWKDKAPLLPSDLYERTHSIICADFVDKKKAWIYTFRYLILLKIYER
ncbi:tau class glutathione transferase [Salix suchowensis]|nr:tau class glutathione transferase [Salix suchowensis]